MASERKEDWISIYTPEGEKKIASPSYIRKLLKIESRDQLLAGVFNRIESLERKVDRLESPGRQAQILELLYKHGKHNRIWIFNRVGNGQWYDIKELVDTGLIVESKAGSVTMYSCAVEA